MKNQEDDAKVTWLIEELYNGITIENEDSLLKEAAVEGPEPDSNENVTRLLGKWFYEELRRSFSQFETVKVRVTLQFEEEL